MIWSSLNITVIEQVQSFKLLKTKKVVTKIGANWAFFELQREKLWACTGYKI